MKEQLQQDLNFMNRNRESRRLFLQAMPLLLAGCATGPKTRYREGDNTGQSADLSVAQEVQMTKEYLPKMAKDYPALRDSQAQSYINKLGQKIVDANGLRGAPYNYNFTVVDTKQINAFALPAGTVFMTAPLIAMADNEAEIAGVLGHEIGHIQARHTAERLSAAKKQQSNSTLFAIGGGILGGGLGFLLGKAVCSKEDKECLKRIATYGAMAGGYGGMLIKKFGFMANSREDEMEADRIAFRTAVKAGYHKDHLGTFYSKLLAMEQQHKGSKNASILGPLTDALSTHPPSESRIQQMREMASSDSQSNGKITSNEFNALKQKLARSYKS